jgi:hypothetical protein
MRRTAISRRAMLPLTPRARCTTSIDVMTGRPSAGAARTAGGRRSGRMHIWLHAPPAPAATAAGSRACLRPAATYRDAASVDQRQRRCRARPRAAALSLRMQYRAAARQRVQGRSGPAQEARRNVRFRRQRHFLLSACCENTPGPQSPLLSGPTSLRRQPARHEPHVKPPRRLADPR